MKGGSISGGHGLGGNGVSNSSDSPRAQLPSQDLARIVSELRRADSRFNDRRRTARMEVRGTLEVMLLSPGRIGQNLQMMARDISFEGLGVASTVQLEAKSLFVAGLPRSETDTMYALCEVMHCSRMAEGLYVLGCQFRGFLTKQQVKERLVLEKRTEMERIRQSVLRN